MTTVVNNTQVRLLALGRKVDRATSNIAQTGDLTLFNVTGGRVIITSIVGTVSTIIQAQANAIKLKSVPTTGTAKDISGTLDINAFEVGALVSLDGTALSTALSGTNAGAALAPARAGILVPIGAIKMNAAASNTGQMSWSITYVPYDDAATVAAA
jgi:hypothetical protein